MEKIAVIGLGYVGLPLAVEFGKVREVIGFDINKKRISELKSGYDHTKEVDAAELKSAAKLSFTDQLEDIRQAKFFIVTVPTPVDEFKKPDLRPLQSSSTSVGKILKKATSLYMNQLCTRVALKKFVCLYLKKKAA